MKQNTDYSPTTRVTQLGKLGTLTTTIRNYNDGTSELHQTLTFLDQNQNVHEVVSSTGDLIFGSLKDLKEVEELTGWISGNSIRDA